MKVLVVKICKIRPPGLVFLAAFISFYISRYHFSLIFRTSFNIIWRKDFCYKSSFFNRFTQTDSTDFFREITNPDHNLLKTFLFHQNIMFWLSCEFFFYCLWCFLAKKVHSNQSSINQNKYISLLNKIQHFITVNIYN